MWSRRSCDLTTLPRAADASSGSRSWLLARLWHRRRALQDRHGARKAFLLPFLFLTALSLFYRKVDRGACTFHSTRRCSGYDASGHCTRSLHLTRVVRCRHAATFRSTRRSRVSLSLSSGTRGILVAERGWEEREVGCHSYDMRPGLRVLGFVKARRRCDWMLIGPSGCHDHEYTGLCHNDYG
jgi:hypothetical protein